MLEGTLGTVVAAGAEGLTPTLTPTKLGVGPHEREGCGGLSHGDNRR